MSIYCCLAVAVVSFFFLYYQAKEKAGSGLKTRK